MAGHDHAGRTRGPGDAEHRAEVAGVGHAVERDEERVRVGEQVVEVGGRHRLGAGEHALRRVGSGLGRQAGAVDVPDPHTAARPRAVRVSSQAARCRPRPSAIQTLRTRRRPAVSSSLDRAHRPRPARRRARPPVRARWRGRRHAAEAVGSSAVPDRAAGRCPPARCRVRRARRGSRRPRRSRARHARSSRCATSPSISASSAASPDPPACKLEPERAASSRAPRRAACRRVQYRRRRAPGAPRSRRRRPPPSPAGVQKSSSIASRKRATTVGVRLAGRVDALGLARAGRARRAARPWSRPRPSSASPSSMRACR